MAVLLLTWILGAGATTGRDGAWSTPNFSQGTLEMTALLNRFVRDDSGQDLIEYGLLVGIITAAAVTAIAAIGPKVTTYYTTLKSNIGA